MTDQLTRTDHPNAVMARKAMDAMSGGHMEAMADMLDDDVVWHEIGDPKPVRGKAALAARMTGREFQITFDVHDVVANDDHTIVLGQAHATRDGRTLDYRTAEIMHVRDGKVTERWAFSDDTAAITAFFA